MSTHKQKIKIARKLRTKEELVNGVPLFQTKGWENRKIAIKNRIQKKIKKIK